MFWSCLCLRACVCAFIRAFGQRHFLTGLPFTSTVTFLDVRNIYVSNIMVFIISRWTVHLVIAVVSFLIVSTGKKTRSPSRNAPGCMVGTRKAILLNHLSLCIDGTIPDLNSSVYVACMQDEVAHFSLPFSFDLIYVGSVDQTEGRAEMLVSVFYMHIYKCYQASTLKLRPYGALQICLLLLLLYCHFFLFICCFYAVGF